MNRLQALKQYGLMDSPMEESFDRLTQLVSKALDVPVALISLVDERRQFFKSQVGLPSPYREERQTPLSHSFCQYVAESSEALVVSDARADSLVFDNCAIRDLGVIAYAGMPLTDAHGHTLGALCAIDTEPRYWTVRELEILQALAAQVMVEIELRGRARRLEEAANTIGGIQNEEDHDPAEARDQARRHLAFELRTPLASLLSSLQVIASSSVLNREQRQYLAMAEQNGRLMRSMLRQMHHMDRAPVKASELDPQPIDLRATIDAVVSRAQPLAQTCELQVVSSLPESIPPFTSDGPRLRRVLFNLLSNAIKFTPVGGRVSINVEPGTDDTLRIIVADTGVGVAEPDLQLIFEHGVSLQRQVGQIGQAAGSGFGLAQCRDILHALGGQIACESQPDKGSRFICTLPLQPDGSA